MSSVCCSGAHACRLYICWSVLLNSTCRAINLVRKQTTVDQSMPHVSCICGHATYFRRKVCEWRQHSFQRWVAKNAIDAGRLLTIDTANDSPWNALPQPLTGGLSLSIVMSIYCHFLQVKEWKTSKYDEIRYAPHHQNIGCNDDSFMPCFSTDSSHSSI